MKKILLTSLIAIFFIACEYNNEDQIYQRVFFEHYSINYAWGLSYFHWIIDNEGNVRANRIKDSIFWINTNELNKSIANFDTTLYKIDKGELNQYIALIELSSKGQIDSIKRSRADFGTTVYNCFWYDKLENVYRTIVLNQRSDFLDITNLDSNAIKIHLWLKSLNVKIYANN